MAKNKIITLGELKNGCIFNFSGDVEKYIATDDINTDDRRLIVNLGNGHREFSPNECIVEIVKCSKK